MTLIICQTMSNHIPQGSYLPPLRQHKILHGERKMYKIAHQGTLYNYYYLLPSHGRRGNLRRK